MTLTTKFGGQLSTGGVIASSLDFMVDPTSAAKKEALVAAYEQHKPGHMAGLQDYFGKHAVTTAPAASAAPATVKMKTNF